MRLLVAPGSKVLSNVPSALRRPMELRVWPASRVNSPPIKILPSACQAMQCTGRSAPGFRESVVERFTVKTATVLVTLPNWLLTTTWQVVPASALWALVTVTDDVVAPDKTAPLFSPWKLRGAVPAAATLTRASWPGLTVWEVGWLLMDGSIVS